MADAQAINMEAVTLNPIEQNARRRYTCMAVLLPWRAHISYDQVEGRLNELEDRIATVFANVLLHWPVFGGKIHASGQDAQLALTYPWTGSLLRRPDLLRFERDESPERWEDISDDIPEGRFFCDDGGRGLDGEGVPAVTLKTTFIKPAIILGFAFHQVVFDAVSMGRFRHAFQDLSWMEGGDVVSTMGHESRPQPWQLMTGAQSLDRSEILGEGGKPGMFPFYNWSGGPVAQPASRLVCRRVYFKRDVVWATIAGASRIANHDNPGAPVPAGSAIASVTAVAFLRVMLQAGRFGRRGSPAVPEAFHLKLASWGARTVLKNEDCMGNSSVTTAATLRPRSLLRLPDVPDDDALGRACSRDEIAEVVAAMQRALRAADEAYVCAYVAVKKHVAAADDWAAYDGARHGSLAVEDWVRFESNAVSLSFVNNEVLQVVPAASYATEAKIVVLPRLGSEEPDGDFPVWCCEEPEVMDLVLRRLRGEGWIEEL